MKQRVFLFALTALFLLKIIFFHRRPPSTSSLRVWPFKRQRIHHHYHQSGHPRQDDIVLSKAKPASAIVYVIPKMNQTQHIRALYTSIQHLFHYFNNDARYPVHIYFEGLSDQIKNDLLLELTFSSPSHGLQRVGHLELIRFYSFHLQTAPEIQGLSIQRIQPILTKGYPQWHNLQNFYFQHLVQLDGLQELDYIWHMSPNVLLQSRLEYDPFEVVGFLNIKYAYTTEAQSMRDTIIQLWQTVSDITQTYPEYHGYLERNQIPIPRVRERMYSPMKHYNTGLEIIHLKSFKENQRLHQFEREISKQKGIYEYGWSANVLRWLSLQMSFDMMKETVHLCDISFTLGNKAYPPTCATPIEFKAASLEYIQRTRMNVVQSNSNIEFKPILDSASQEMTKSVLLNKMVGPQLPSLDSKDARKKETKPVHRFKPSRIKGKIRARPQQHSDPKDRGEI